MTTIEKIRSKYSATNRAEPPPAVAEPKPTVNPVVSALKGSGRPTYSGLGSKRVRWTQCGPDDAVLLFGKNEGRKLSEIAATSEGQGYLRWILAEDFPAELKDLVRRASIKAGGRA